jgi:hypothetical protein
MKPVLIPLMVLAALAGGCSGRGDSDEMPSTTPRSEQSGDAENAESPAGTLTGRLLVMGGPQPGRRALSRGTITFTGASPSKAPVDAHGNFSVRLRPGTYKITATSPDYSSGDRLCVAGPPVQVADGSDASVDVYCSLR